MKKFLFLAALIFNLSNTLTAQTLFNKEGIKLTYTSAVVNTVFCKKENKQVYYIKYRFTISNNSDREARITVNFTTPRLVGNMVQAVCVSENTVFDNPSIERRSIEPILKPGEQDFAEATCWYPIEQPGTPRFDVFYEFAKTKGERSVSSEKRPKAVEGARVPKSAPPTKYQDDQRVNPADESVRKLELQKIKDQASASKYLVPILPKIDAPPLPSTNNAQTSIANRAEEEAARDIMKRQKNEWAEKQIENIRTEHETAISNTSTITEAVVGAAETIIKAVSDAPKKESAGDKERRYAEEDEADRRADDRARYLNSEKSKLTNGVYKVISEDGYNIKSFSPNTTEAGDLVLAEAGDMKAQIRLGRRYLNGLVTTNENGQIELEYYQPKAFKWFLKAAEQGNAEAQYWLGWMYQNTSGLHQMGLGPEVKTNDADALKWYRKSADQGYPDAILKTGQLAELNQNYADAHVWYQKIKSIGKTMPDAALYALGFMHEKGLGVSQSYPEAIRWYKETYDSGDAMLRLGLLYARGDGVPENFVEAEQWFKKAIKTLSENVENGSYTSAYLLGYIYEKGLGASVDIVKARHYYQIGNEGVDSYGPTALRLLAHRGYPAAQFKLGALYHFGGEYIAKDNVKAGEWVTRAAEQGFEDAIKALQPPK